MRLNIAELFALPGLAEQVMIFLIEHLERLDRFLKGGEFSCAAAHSPSAISLSV